VFVRFSTRLALAAMMAVAGALSACTGQQSYGTVAGMAAPCVGVARLGTTSVTIYARQDGRIVKRVRVLLTRSPGNPYRLTLASGTYVLSAPRSDLPPRTVNIRPHETVKIDFHPSCK
jgi:hypothetical protein